MQGLWIRSAQGVRRPKSKKEVKETLTSSPNFLFVQSTSVFGNEYEGRVDGIPEGVTVYYVGPDPYNSRKFYGSLTMREGKVTAK